MEKRTFDERVAQLGRIVILEGDLMQERNQHGVMPRTKKAKEILCAYSRNVFGRILDVCGDDRYISENLRFSNDQWRGLKVVRIPKRYR